VVTGLLFLAGTFLVPLISMVGKGITLGGASPAYYPLTAPALVVVGYLMVSVVKDIPFRDFSEGFPAFLTMILIPLTSSIAHGIGYGFITYVVLHVLSGKWRVVHPLMYLVSILFALSFIIR
jgi:AGZA family xanthine/uracil permease-like MFS transporter